MNPTMTVAGRVPTASRPLWLTVGLILAWQVGAHVDAWYHIHFGSTIESFFTWPHALLYGGWVGTGLVVVLHLWRHRLRPTQTPRGYSIILIGVALFALGGAFDLLWHSLFGFEVDLETLFSPSHLWLVLAFTIAAFGLLEVAIEQRARVGAGKYVPRLQDLPLMLGLAILFRAVLWNFFYSEPLANDYPAGGALTRHFPGYQAIAWENVSAQVAGTTGMILHSILLALFTIVPLRTLRLPGGTIAIMLFWEGVLVVGSTDLWIYLPAVAGAALAGEAIWAWVWRGGLGGLEGAGGYWLLGSVVPLVELLLYFWLMHAFGGGIAWTTHLWAGTAAMAGVYGLIAGLLVVPPRFIRQSQKICC